MATKWNVLARLFGRTDNLVITQLYTHALGRPLLVEPRVGESLLNAYMQGAVDAPPPMKQSSGAIAVINISGALVSRPTPGLCDDGPVNYEALRDTFDQVLADSNVSAIILRMDTPGGMAAGLFDFTDHVFESRGTKPILAVVDDMAYSAGYAIAAAADEIWVTRTAGVGSVGVVAYHIDQSEYDKKVGVKVTPMYAGARKLDFSPHFPLSDEAKAREQAEVDRLYAIFTESVARYRGLDVDTVRETEAGTFNGTAAIEAKFADKLGTFRDAVASLSAPAAISTTAAADPSKDEDDEQQKAASGAAAAEVEAQKKAAAAEAQRIKGLLASRLVQSGLPSNLSTTLLAIDGIKEDEIDARIDHAKTIRDLCVAAGLENCAEGYVKSYTDVEAARVALLEATASQGEELVTSLPAPGAAAPSLASRLDPQSIYLKRAAK